MDSIPPRTTRDRTPASFSRAFIILNPAARHGRAGGLEAEVRALFDGRVCYELECTTEPWHAEALARRAVAEGFDVVIAAGGDGTFHEVANGILSESGRIVAPGGRRSTRTALAVLPLGSGNDYARTLGIPNDARKAAEAIFRGETQQVDAGVCNGKIFTNSVGIGFDGRVTHRAAEMKLTSSLSGFPLYFAALTDVLRHDFHGYVVDLTIDGKKTSACHILFITVTHGPTYGGGFRITPQALNGDGLFDYCLIDDLSLADALWRIPLVVAGKHNWMGKVHAGRAKHIVLEADEELFAQLDGETYRARRFELTVLPRVLTAVVSGRGAL